MSGLGQLIPDCMLPLVLRNSSPFEQLLHTSNGLGRRINLEMCRKLYNFEAGCSGDSLGSADCFSARKTTQYCRIRTREV